MAFLVSVRKRWAELCALQLHHTLLAWSMSTTFCKAYEYIKGLFASLKAL